MDAAARLERDFAARVGNVHDDAPGSLLGIEQEFSVRTMAAARADFRSLLAQFPVIGTRLDPNAPNAYRPPAGVVVPADGHEAEAAPPPLAVRPGIAEEATAWARAARREIEAVLLGTHT